MLLRHANPPSQRVRGFLSSPMGRETTITALALACAVWWGIGGWAAVPFLICLTLMSVASAAFGVQVGIGLARRGVEGDDSTTVSELLACLGARR